MAAAGSLQNVAAALGTVEVLHLHVVEGKKGAGPDRPVADNKAEEGSLVVALDWWEKDPSKIDAAVGNAAVGVEVRVGLTIQHEALVLVEAASSREVVAKSVLEKTAAWTWSSAVVDFALGVHDEACKASERSVVSDYTQAPLLAACAVASAKPLIRECWVGCRSEAIGAPSLRVAAASYWTSFGDAHQYPAAVRVHG